MKKHVAIVLACLFAAAPSPAENLFSAPIGDPGTTYNVAREFDRLVLLLSDDILRDLVCRVTYERYTPGALGSALNLPRAEILRRLETLRGWGLARLIPWQGGHMVVEPVPGPGARTLRRWAARYCPLGDACGRPEAQRYGGERQKITVTLGGPAGARPQSSPRTPYFDRFEEASKRTDKINVQAIPSNKRLFVAIPLPDNIREQLASMSADVAGARWLPREQMHLTLRFIGEVDRATFRAIASALKGISQTSFRLKLIGVGYFPNARRPRVIWVGVNDELKLERLNGKVEAILREVGLPSENRKYKPHVALARLKSPSKEKVRDFLVTHARFKSQTFSVEGFNLYSSQLGASGAVHTIEAAFAFEGT